jgi:hypothetical protein
MNAKKIRIEYEDGSVKEAIGEDAEKILQHWSNCEFFWANHGFEYSGPCLQEVKGPKKPKKTGEKMIKYVKTGKLEILNPNENEPKN